MTATGDTQSGTTTTPGGGRWYGPLLGGACASLIWALSFAVVADGGGRAVGGVLAYSAIGGVAALAAAGGARLKVRARLWLGALLFGLGHVPVLGIAHAYLWKTAAPAYPLLLLYLASFPAVCVYACARLSARWPRLPLALTVPLVWVALEYLRGEWLLGGYPWYLLGQLLTTDGGPSWLASWIGVYGCSLMLAVIGAAVIDVGIKLNDPRKAGLVFGLMLAAVPVLAGFFLGPCATATPLTAYRTLRVAVLQTNLPQDNKIGWKLKDRIDQHKHWLDLSRAAATASGETKRPQLIVWPETMFPGQALNPEALEVQRRSGLSYSVEGAVEPLPVTWFADTLLKTQADLDIPFLVGAITADDLAYERTASGGTKASGKRYNSAVMVTDGRSQRERYDKIDLMAFGEYIPVVYRWPAVQNWLTGLGAQGMAFDLGFGKERTLFNVEGVRVGTPICFEICHEGTCRAFTTAPDGSRRAELLINLTNDGWFYDSDFNRKMHQLQARWRCAETDTPMVRAANTGISGLIDSNGRVVTKKMEDGGELSQREGVVTVDVPVAAPGTPATLYARGGYLVGPVVGCAGGADGDGVLASAADGLSGVVPCAFYSQRPTRKASLAFLADASGSDGIAKRREGRCPRGAE
ncbi:MAG: apolipoprotein N-acyltransferase [Phycisphaerales bacterium]